MTTPVMEHIVRPFQTPLTIAGGRVILSVQKQYVAPAEIRWGSVGALPTPVESTPFVVNFNTQQCDRQYTEASRKTTPIRVENPNDSSQYVNVDRIDNISFKNKDPNEDNFSYVSYAVTQAMADFAANFSSGDTQQICNSSYTLNWGKTPQA